MISVPSSNKVDRLHAYWLTFVRENGRALEVNARFLGIAVRHSGFG